MTNCKLEICCITSALLLIGCNNILEPVSLFVSKQDITTRAGQEEFEINIKSLSFATAKKANSAPYSRQLILTGSGSKAKVIDEDNFLKIFLNICETIILKLGASPKYKNSRDYIFSLKDLFLKFNNQPTKTEIGLWGELATIYFSNNSESLIKSWHVSGKEIFDFNFEKLKIEVKTTKKTVRTHNLKHTQFIRLKKLKGLYLSYLLLETDNWKSCIELSDLILAELNSNTREMFIEKLIECVGNSLENFNHRFDLNYSEINLAAYSSEDIDYIEEKSLSSNISNINYDLNFEPFEKIKEQTNNDLFNLLPQLSH